MIKFKLENNEIVVYDTIKNQLIYNNVPFILENKLDYEKTYDLKLRLFLGNKCNFDCKYCLQDYIKKDKDPKVDIDKFCNDLRKFLGSRKVELSFWGGETLLYMNYIKELTEKLNDKIDKIYITTNGSTLGIQNHFKWIKDNLDRIGRITVSYDGPGQSLRGYDILTNDNILFNIRYLIENNKLAFNGVITKENNSFENYINFLKNKLELNDFNKLRLEMGVLSVTHNKSLDCLLSEDEYLKFMIDYYNYIYDNNLSSNIYMLQDAIKSTLFNLNNTNQSSPCSTNNPYCLSTKLNGDVVVCHNGPSGKFTTLNKLIPNTLVPIPTKKIITTKNWNSICKDCFVKYLCNGGCANEPKEFQEYNCLSYRNRYLFVLLCTVSSVMNSKIVYIEFIDEDKND